MSYTPTEWKSGDTITSEKLNKMEQGIASAGGGTGGLIVTLSDVGGIPTMDTTYKDIAEAFSAGQSVVVRMTMTQDDMSITTLSPVVGCGNVGQCMVEVYLFPASDSPPGIEMFTCDTEDDYPNQGTI